MVYHLRPANVSHSPGTWERTTGRASLPGEDLASTHPVSMTCPNGHSFFLAARVHSIAPDGTVTPSVICSDAERGCSFHEFVVLDGWTP